jgi:putative phosphoribosyl transferase
MFENRQEAGRLLAHRLNQYKSAPQTIVLGLARGGVVVAAEVALALSLPLNVVVPRKIGAPGNPELALGSIMEDGSGIFNTSIIHMLGVSRSYLDREIEREKARAHQRLTLYRQYAPLPNLEDQTIILVDDGVATGSTMLASIQAMRQAEVKQVVVAVPVASTDALALLEKEADEVVCLFSREDFVGVGMYYRRFDQTEDEEVVHLLKHAHETQAKKKNPPSTHFQVQNEVHIPLGRGVTLVGELVVPSEAKGIVLFAHGSGSSRFSPRNQFVAKALQNHHLGTLLVDLLTSEEDRVDQFTREFRFNIDLLAERLIGVTDWLLKQDTGRTLSIGYFGASTGAAAALIAAADKFDQIAAVVSRGGRPDLAELTLSEVKAPTLLIVGGEDTIVIELNEQAYAKLTCQKKLEIVPGATHLFEEPGTLEQVAHLAAQWFVTYLIHTEQ